jgi:hypothetical protein
MGSIESDESEKRSSSPAGVELDLFVSIKGWANGEESTKKIDNPVKS